jgi:hypothetical protein
MTQIANTFLQLPDGVITSNTIASNAEILHTQLRQRALQSFPINPTQYRVWDANHTNAVGTAASDDLALTTAALTGSGASYLLSAGDCKNLGATTRRVAFFMPIPANYEDGQTVQFRIRTKMETTVASSSCTVDLEAFVVSTGTTVGSDLVTTAATDMNSLTAADKDFVIDASAVNPSDVLQCRLSIACSDTGTATAVTPVVISVALLCDTRG